MKVPVRLLDLSDLAQTDNDSIDSTSGLNNQTSFVDVTGLILPSQSKSGKILMDVEIEATADRDEFFEISYKLRQNGTYVYTITRVSDPDSLVEFRILNSGQVQYKSPDSAGFIALTFNWRVISTN
jgi:hypothetical protein